MSGARSLPADLGAERAVLGGLLVSPRLFAEVAARVDAVDFHHPAHRAIFGAMADLDAASQPLDAVTVAERMRNAGSFGCLRAHDGEAYFVTLTESVVTVENLPHYARIVRGKAIRRRLIEAAQGIAAKGYEDAEDIDEYLAESERALLSVTGQAAPKEPRSFRSVLRPTVDAIGARWEERQRGRIIVGVSTGNEELDGLLGGFRSSNQYVLAGVPGTGKSALAMQWVTDAAEAGAAAALVFQLEMSAEQQVERTLSAKSNVDGLLLRNGWIGKRDWPLLTRGASRVAEAPIWFIDDADIRLREIRAITRRWAGERRREKPGLPLLVVVDYLQLIEGDDDGRKAQTREREIGRFSRGLKKLAKELQASTIVLSQLNRASQQGEKPRRPRKSDLRDSGQIEADADVIILLHEVKPGIVEAIVDKNRHGPTAIATLRFLKNVSRFEAEGPRREVIPFPRTATGGNDGEDD